VNSSGFSILIATLAVVAMEDRVINVDRGPISLFSTSCNSQSEI